MDNARIIFRLGVLTVCFLLSVISIHIKVFAQAGQVNGLWTDNNGVNHQCPPDCGGSSGYSSGSTMDYSQAYNLGVAIWQMGQQQAENDAALLRQQELQRQEAARIARENQLRREEEQRQNHAQLMSELSLLDSSEGPGSELKDKNTRNDLELLPMDDSKELKPAGTSFFGLGELLPEGQDELKKIDEAWVNEQKWVISKRLEEPNKWCESIFEHLKYNEQLLPPKKFSELKPGDTLIVNASGASWAIAGLDNLLSGFKASKGSHTVLYLKEVNGKKYFLENVPGEGPRIILEDEYQKKYKARGAQVASLVQPLNEQEAKKLYAAAVELAAKNRKSVIGTPLFGTDYGIWGKDDIVCSEADWAVLKTVRDIPRTGNRIKRFLGVDFSPADLFNNEQYFLVTPLGKE